MPIAPRDLLCSGAMYRGTAGFESPPPTAPGVAGEAGDACWYSGDAGDAADVTPPLPFAAAALLLLT